jgi:hypothetical protein
MLKSKNVRISLRFWWRAYILTRLSQIFFRRRITIVPSVRLDSKGTVGTIIKWNSSSTDDVCNGNRRPINSRHTEVCQIQLDMYRCLDTRSGYNAFQTTIPTVLANSLLHCFHLGVGHDHEHLRQYGAQSVQSCDASKQLLQGGKQQKFYIQINSIAFCRFYSPVFSVFIYLLRNCFI